MQEISDKNKWNDLLSSSPGAGFLQSWEWGEFQKSIGHQVKRLSRLDQIFVQAIKMSLPLGKFYWYIPRGPNHYHLLLDHRRSGAGKEENKGRFGGFWQDLADYFKADGSLFVRVDPETPSPLGEGRRGVKIQTTSSTQPQCA